MDLALFSRSYRVGAVALLLSCGVGCGGADDGIPPGNVGGSASVAGSGATTAGAGSSSNPTGGVSGGANGGAGQTTGGTSAAAGAAGGGAGATSAGAGGVVAMGGGSTGGAGGTIGAGGSSGSGTGQCIKADPPADMKETIDLTWKEMTGGFAGKMGARNLDGAIQEYPNWAIDNVMRSKGSINFCIRWDSDQAVSATLRDQLEDELKRGVNAWFSALSNYDCFPYPEIAVKITGWAVRSRATLGWAEESYVPIYVNQISDGAPACSQACSGYAHSDPDYEFPNCTAGADKRWDQEVWLTENYDSPNGWAWGQHVDRKGFTDRVTGSLYHIWLHEFGHGIGFPDYYDWDVWAPGIDAPKCVMNAGAATTVTDWDKWMLKRTWSELRASGRWK